MVMTKVPISDNVLDGPEHTYDFTQLNISYDQVPIITLTENEVAWFFGTDINIVEEWVTCGILTPCSITSNGSKRFWREHIAGLLAICGA